jgi:hypothetical protein
MSEGANQVEIGYTVDDIATRWALRPATVRRLFEKEPDLLRSPHPGAPHKQKFVRLRIPEIVVERVHARLSCGTKECG